MRYDNPSVNGVLIDHCASWGTNCGQGGANAFCRRQGHGAARSFQVKNPGRTVVLADNQVCEGGNCVGFTQVVCTGTGPVSPPPVTPPVSPPLAPPQAAASIDCWRTSNAFVEQVDNGWRGVYTRTGPDRFAVQYRHVGGETRTTSTQMFGAKQTGPGIWSVEFKRDDYPMLRADIPVGNPLVGAGSYQGGNKFTLTCGAR